MITNSAAKFLGIVLSERIEIRDGRTFQINQNKNKEQKVEFLTVEVNSPIPQFLLKFSSTYFQKASIPTKGLSKWIKKQLESKKRKLQQFSNPMKFSKIAESSYAKPSLVEKQDSAEKERNGENLQIDAQQTKREGFQNSFSVEKQVFTPEKSQQINFVTMPINLQQQKADTNSFSISEENIQITSQLATQTAAHCVICFENLSDCVIMDCGHGGICVDCGMDLWKKSNQCYLCRQSINKLLVIKNGSGKYKPIMKTLKKNIQEFSENNKKQEKQS